MRRERETMKERSENKKCSWISAKILHICLLVVAKIHFSFVQFTLVI